MEFKVNEYQLPVEISFNFDELKAELTEKVKKYELMTYTEEQIKEAKADRANLNKLKKALNDERIRREREYMQPFEEFKGKIKEIIAIIDKPVAVIDAQIKAAEEKRKEAKQLEIGSLFVVKEFPTWVRINMIQDDTWLNATTSMKQIEDNLDGWKNRIETEVKTIESLPEFSFEAMEIYRQTLDMAKAIAEGQRLADIQRRKQEAEEARKKAEEEAAARRAEEEARRAQEEAEKAGQEQAAGYAEGIQEPATAQPEEKPKNTLGATWINFRAFLTIDQAIELREFFISRDIDFEAN